MEENPTFVITSITLVWTAPKQRIYAQKSIKLYVHIFTLEC